MLYKAGLDMIHEVDGKSVLFQNAPCHHIGSLKELSAHVTVLAFHSVSHPRRTKTAVTNGCGHIVGGNTVGKKDTLHELGSGVQMKVFLG